MYSDLENAYLDDYMAYKFPPLPEEEQSQAEIKAYDPTMREKLHAFLQAGIQATTGVDKCNCTSHGWWLSWWTK
jgi:hypothetical protein